MSDYILQTKGLLKRFKNQMAVKDVTLSIRKNTIFGLLGPNGAGKSTTLKMITGILKPTSGEILFNDHEWSREDLKHIGALIESPAIYSNLSAMDNLKVACTLYGLHTSRANEVLDIIGLENVGNKKVRNYSMGMKQRLGLGMAIINNPELLILDEPTNGLDPIGIEELRNLIRSFPAKGITVIVSSHILSEISLIADEMAIIANGTIGYQGIVNKDENLEDVFMKVVGRNRGDF